MRPRPLLITVLALFIALQGAATRGSADQPIPELGRLDLRQNEQLKALRQDVRKTIYTIKSGRCLDELPELQFYRYRVRPGDTFWTVLAKTSMDIDTLLSVNDLSSPLDINKKKSLYIPNMRGVIVSGEKSETVHSLASEAGVDLAYVFHANRCSTLDKNYIFVPCGKISMLQRSLFLGTAFMNPLAESRRSSGFGTRKNPFNGRTYEFHRGIDLACPMKSKVMAARKGRVVFTGYKGGYGNLVVLQHEMGYSTYYGHLSSFTVRPGDVVEAGDVIARSGNSGRTTGPHLHFEIRRGGTALNPSNFLHR
ncbi:MAG TPA: LysM peptidoglycan-binding domain-containing M23 family metallopeptidase [Spirochaetota bacterium]|nr:LysM peptidoglycan-binding domain-containing M23 family metallopeptidase [Spirochaetota bacterium]HPI88616.1 LysM peptidoglycan-binding domain-containing M23 family metallopeptidase [Spirochaetota bacterium]HPR48257.1 LysM peptidoglycan-binding domain-containing M23 family metallopeptidase [Spirochaetota bacterium]